MESLIYNRVSTEEQNPENQIKDCVSLAKSLNIEDYRVLEEQKSAFKDNEKREQFNLILSLIKKNKVGNLIVWDLDRLYRDRKKLIEFFQLTKAYKTKVHSYRQQWLNDLNNIPSPFNEIMFDLMIQILGWLAEEESRKKSERVKAAIRVKDGVKQSYKGNKWGRPSLSKKTKQRIRDMWNEGVSMKRISRELFYWDKNGNKKNVSVGVVHKIIHGKA